MRIRVAEQTGHPVPQFVVYADDETERAILGAFTNYKQNSKQPVQFWLHGSTYSCDVSGVTSFNFGYIYEQKPPSLRERIRRWWLCLRT